MVDWGLHVGSGQTEILAGDLQGLAPAASLSMPGGPGDVSEAVERLWGWVFGVLRLAGL